MTITQSSSARRRRPAVVACVVVLVDLAVLDHLTVEDLERFGGAGRAVVLVVVDQLGLDHLPPRSGDAQRRVVIGAAGSAVLGSRLTRSQ